MFFHTVEHLLEQDSFVRGVLIEQNQAAVGFENDVQLSNHPHQAQRNIQERLRVTRRRCNAEAFACVLWILLLLRLR